MALKRTGLEIVLELRERLDGIRRFSRGIEDIKRKVSSLRGSLERLQKAAEAFANTSKRIAIVGAAVTGALAAPVTAAATFEEGMARVSTMLDMSFEKTKKVFGGPALNLARKFGSSLSDITNAMYQSLSASVPKENLISFLETAGKAAVAGATDLKTAVDGLTSALNAYKIPVSEAAKVSDVFFAAVKAGKTTFPEIARSLGEVAPFAAEAGVKLDELLAAMAYLTKSGLSTSEAFTGLKYVLQGITNPTSEAGKMFDKLGVQIDGNTLRQKGLLGTLKELILAVKEHTDDEAERERILAKIFGSIEGYNAMLSLTSDNMKGFAEVLNMVRRSTGATEEAFKKMSQTTYFQFRRAIAGVKVLGVMIGDALLPSINRLLRRIQSGLGPLVKWIKAHKELVGKITQVVGIVGVASVALGTFGWVAGKTIGGIISFTRGIGTVIKTLRLLSVSLLTTPIGWFALAVATAALLIFKYWRPVVAFLKGVAEGIREALGPIKPILEGILRPLRWILNAVLSLISPVKASEGELRNAAESGKKLGLILGRILKPILLGIKEVFEWVAAVVKALTGDFSLLKQKVSDYLTFWSGIGEKIKSAFIDALKGFGEKIKSIFIDPLEAVKGWLESFSLFEVGKKIIKSLIDGLKSLAKEIYDTVMAPFRKLEEALSKLNPFSWFQKSKTLKAGEKVSKTFGEGIGKGKGDIEKGIENAFSIFDLYAPQSDAKKGPFSRLTSSGIAVVATMAKGIKKGKSIFGKVFESSLAIPQIWELKGIKKALTFPVFSQESVPKLPSILTAPRLGFAGAPAGHNITVNYTANINISGENPIEIGKEVKKAIRESGDEFKRVLEKLLERERRLLYY